MQFIGSFSTFNPLTGYFSRPYSDLGKSVVRTGSSASDDIQFPLILDWMTGRAQNIIRDRQISEIENALDTINYLFHLAELQYTPTIEPNDAIQIAFNSAINRLPIELFTPARILNSQVKEYDIGDNKLFRNGHWEEYFAILALAILGDIHRFYQSKEDISVEIAAFAAEAMEALTIAESPGLIAAAMDPAFQKQSSRNRDNAIQGHAELNALKSLFGLWVTNEYLPNFGDKSANKREAARTFLTRIASGKVTVDCATILEEQKDLVRTLADSLTRDPRFKNT